MASVPHAVLWDMDGTLVDSFAAHMRAWQVALAAEGVPASDAQLAATFGQRNDTILRGLMGAAATPEAISRIGMAKEARYRDLVRAEGVSLLPGALEWLGRLRSAGWRQAIASAAPRANVETILEVLQLGPFFDGFVSAEDVERGKPDPQVFQLAAARLGALPAGCVVVEDAPAGLEGARRAGMRCIGVRSSAHPTLQADIVVDRLDQLPFEAFASLIG